MGVAVTPKREYRSTRAIFSHDIQSQLPNKTVGESEFVKPGGTCITRDTSLILILSDINMPGMSGLILLPKAKAARPDVPVIMITAHGDAETRRKALASGANAFLTKPIDFAIIRSEIDMQVGHAA